MVPTVFKQIDEMLQTLNGKRDVKALPKHKLKIAYVGPKKMEQTICEICSSFPDIEIIDVRITSFEIGSNLIFEFLKKIMM